MPFYSPDYDNFLVEKRRARELQEAKKERKCKRKELSEDYKQAQSKIAAKRDSRRRRQ